MGVVRIHLGLVFALLIPLAVWGEESKVEDPWRTFHLATVQVQGVTLRYERLLSPKLEDIRQALSDFVKEERRIFAQADTLRAKPEEIVDQVNKIVGLTPTEKQKDHQREILSTFLGKGIRLAEPGHEMAVYLVTVKSTKDYLRKGGSLPDFSYDKAKDEATYNFRIHWRSSRGGRWRKGEITIPVPGEQPVQKFSNTLGMLRRNQSGSIGLALHELIEVTMLSYRLKPRDPYFRWFSDGFANAVVIHVLKGSFGEDAAAEFAGGYDISKYHCCPR